MNTKQKFVSLKTLLFDKIIIIAVGTNCKQIYINGNVKPLWFCHPLCHSSSISQWCHGILFVPWIWATAKKYDWTCSGAYRSIWLYRLNDLCLAHITSLLCILHLYVAGKLGSSSIFLALLFLLKMCVYGLEQSLLSSEGNFCQTAWSCIVSSWPLQTKRLAGQINCDARKSVQKCWCSP